MVEVVGAIAGRKFVALEGTTIGLAISRMVGNTPAAAGADIVRGFFGVFVVCNLSVRVDSGFHAESIPFSFFFRLKI